MRPGSIGPILAMDCLLAQPAPDMFFLGDQIVNGGSNLAVHLSNSFQTFLPGFSSHNRLRILQPMHHAVGCVEAARVKPNEVPDKPKPDSRNFGLTAPDPL
jgi:hypothetical protein